MTESKQDNFRKYTDEYMAASDDLLEFVMRLSGNSHFVAKALLRSTMDTIDFINARKLKIGEYD